MKYYKLLKINSLIKSNRLKILGVSVLALFNKRFYSVFLDPVLACNFRCLMCYFSAPSYKPSHSKFELENLPIVADKFFKNALKLQIGCGAEPSLYKHNVEIIQLAKKYGVPHISFTTNASLLNFDKIYELVSAGLDEIIVSMHGTSKEVYEKMMPGSNFEKFNEILSDISKIKNEFPNFKLRINYTVNPDNINDLNNFEYYLKNYSIDILQIRPIRKVQNSIYNDFDLKRKQEVYTKIVSNLELLCQKYNVISIITPKIPDAKIMRKVPNVAEYTYCYVSADYWGEDGFKGKDMSYRKFLFKTGFFKSIIKDVFFTKSRLIEADVNFGNYEVNV